MKHFVPTAFARFGRTQRGLTLIELMVAITVGIFLVGGILTMVQSTRRTFGDQNQLAQLQDSERLAMNFMTDVIESAGYFPNPKLYTAAAVMPVAPNFVAGQAIFGTMGGPGGDTITSRYGAGNPDNVFNCLGQKNTAVAPYDTFTNTFWVKNPQQQLMCTFIGSAAAPQPVVLVNGVQSLNILYGVKRNLLVDTGSCTDTYLTAAQMVAPADWNNVCSVIVTLQFTNPLTPAGPPIVIKRVISVMNTAGVNT
jgi:type IV pilus assembly protein PilW